MSNKRTIILQNPNNDRVNYVKIMASGPGMVLDTQTSAGLYLNASNSGGFSTNIGRSSGFQIFDNGTGNGGVSVNLTGQAPIQFYSGTPTNNGSGYISFCSDATIEMEVNKNVNSTGDLVLRNKSIASPGGNIILTNQDGSQMLLLANNPTGAYGFKILNPHKKMYINNTATSNGGIEIVNNNSGNIQIMNTSPSSYVLINHAVGSCQLYMDDTGVISLGSTNGLQVTNSNSGDITVLNSGGGLIKFYLGSPGSYIQIDGSTISIAPYNGKTELTGGIQYSVSTITSSSTTITEYVHIVLFDTDAVGANITANLPSVSGKSGQKYVFKNIGSTYNVIVEPDGTEMIEGSSNFTLLPGESIDIVCNGSAWYII